MVFGMTYMEFIGLIAALVALVITIQRARITPTAEAVELLLEPLNASLENCSEGLEDKEKEIAELMKDHKKWKAYMIAFINKVMKEFSDLNEKLENQED